LSRKRASSTGSALWPLPADFHTQMATRRLECQWTPSVAQRVMFWGAIGTVNIVGAIWGWPIDRVAHIERTFVGALGEPRSPRYSSKRGH
jgi:hypothetical protein